MEFPDLGGHCDEPTCKKYDFLPIKCDACNKLFCSEHMRYEKHNCPSAHKKNVQVPICGLCGTPIPGRRNKKSDNTVSEHSAEDCQAARVKKKKNSHKCSIQGCKVKEMVPVICNQCSKNFCLQHRFPESHNCTKKRSGPLEAALRRRHESSFTDIMSLQGSMSEDEALARALYESMKEEDRLMNRHRENSESSMSKQMNFQGCQVS